MKKTLLTLFLLSFSYNYLTQSPIEWEFTAGGIDKDKGRELVLTDGGVIVITKT